jgi:hypothetical protein
MAKRYSEQIEHYAMHDDQEDEILEDPTPTSSM